MSSSDFSIRPAGRVSAPTRGLVTASEATFGAATVGVFATAYAFVRWVTTSNAWIFFVMVTKPLIDLTWKWEFFNIFNQRVNPQAIVAIIVVALNGIVLVSSRRSPRHSRRVILFLGLATLSVIVTPTSWGINELLRLFSGLSFFFTAGFVLREKQKFDRFAVFLLAALGVPLVLSLLQVAGILPYEYWDRLEEEAVGRASGTYQHPLDLVFFLVYAVPLALYGWDCSGGNRAKRVFLMFFGLLAFLGLVFTFHRTGWIALSLELALWYGSKEQLKKIVFGGLAIAVLVMVFSDTVSLLYQPATDMFTGEGFASGDFLRGRGANWVAFLASYANGGPVRWLLGKGGSVAEVSIGGLIEYAENEPHNDFIRILHAYGLVGLCLYLSLLATFLRSALRSRNSINPFHRGVGRVLLCSTGGVLLLSLMAEPMRYPTAIWYLFALGSTMISLETKGPAVGSRGAA